MTELSKRYEVVGVHAFTYNTEDGMIHARNFAPLYEIDEEAATGTSNGALTYYLYDYGMIEPEKIYTVVQGEKMQRPSKISTQLILMFKELNEFFAEIKQEAAEFAESFRSNPRMLEVHMNDIKNRLSAKVSDMFGIEYHYTISSVDFFRGGEVAHAQGREYLCGNPQGERPEPSGA